MVSFRAKQACFLVMVREALENEGAAAASQAWRYSMQHSVEVRVVDVRQLPPRASCPCLVCQVHHLTHELPVR
jgi:hypothetical protein